MFSRRWNVWGVAITVAGIAGPSWPHGDFPLWYSQPHGSAAHMRRRLYWGIRSRDCAKLVCD